MKEQKYHNLKKINILYFFVMLLIFCAREKSSAIEVLVQGAGASFATNLFNALIFTYISTTNQNVPTSITYLGSNANAGLCRIEDFQTCAVSDNLQPHSVDFGAVISPLTPYDFENYTDIQTYPAVAGAVVPIINLPFLLKNSSFVLTQAILAEIYLGHLTKWSDETIINENPSFASELRGMKNPTIQVCVRKDNAGQTQVWTEALSRANAEFSKAIGITSSPSKWSKSFSQRKSGYGVAAFVSATLNSIGYVVMGDAELYRLFVPLIRKGNQTIKANTISVFYAVSELGQSFGNNGDAPSHLTADLMGAKSELAWPMVSYVYLVMRKNTLCPNATCQNRHETLNFWLWVYSSPAAVQVTAHFGFASLPEDLRLQMINKLKTDIECEGESLVKLERPVSFGIAESVINDLQYLLGSYNTIFYPDATFSVISLSENHTVAMSSGVSLDLIITVEDFPPDSSYLSVPFAVNGFVFIFNCEGITALTFNDNIISKLLAGEIRSWNDSSLVSINPQLSQIKHRISFFMSTASFQLQSQVLGPLSESGRKFVSNFLNTDIQTILEVAEMPYSLAIVPFSAQIALCSLAMSAYLRPDNNVVQPSLASFKECAQDTLNLNMALNLASSSNRNCYPFTYSYQFVIKKKFFGEDCAMNTSAGFVIAYFAQWILKRGRFASASGASFSAIYSLHDYVYSHIKKSLLLITCDDHSILSIAQNYNYISEWARPVAIAFASLAAVLGSFFLAWLVVYRKHRVVKKSQPEFLAIFISGAVCISFSLIPLSLDDNGVDYYDLDDQLDLSISSPTLDMACLSIPWLYLTGYALEFSALFVKVYRLKKILLHKKLKKVALPFKKMVPFVLGLILLTWVFCAVWTAIDPLRWERVPVAFNSANVMIDSYGHCTSTSFAAFFGVIVSVQVGLLVIGSVLCYQTRNVKDEFVEGKWISLILLNLLSTLLFSVLLGCFMTKYPQALFGIFLINISLTGVCSMLIIMIPKLVTVILKLESQDSQSSNGLVLSCSGAGHGNKRVTGQESIKASGRQVLVTGQGNATLGCRDDRVRCISSISGKVSGAVCTGQSNVTLECHRDDRPRCFSSMSGKVTGRESSLETEKGSVTLVSRLVNRSRSSISSVICPEQKHRNSAITTDRAFNGHQVQIVNASHGHQVQIVTASQLLATQSTEPQTP